LPPSPKLHQHLTPACFSLAAGLLAKKASRRVCAYSHISTLLASCLRIVTEYLTETGPMPTWSSSGLTLHGYGCTTRIGITWATHRANLLCHQQR
jgi:aconitase A